MCVCVCRVETSILITLRDMALENALLLVLPHLLLIASHSLLKREQCVQSAVAIAAAAVVVSKR